MTNYKLTIQYDGTRYRGWQRLGAGENTIQGKLEGVLNELEGEPVELVGCSRTDAGVHAMAQTANVKLKGDQSEDEVMIYLNHYLPQDISVIAVSKVPESFHARYHAISKVYLYRIWNRKYSNPFMRKYSMHVIEPLNGKDMRRAAAYFVGEHDFTAFSNAKSKKKSMVRQIYAVELEELEGFVNIRIHGNGFLYNMVRKIVGILIEVGTGKISAEDVPEIISSQKRSRIGILADAGGLFLEKIEYPESGNS